MKDIIRYGIVGIGGMGANHANLFLQNKIKNGSLEAICDTNDEFAKNFPNVPFYKEADSFFDKKLIDVAIIATPHSCLLYTSPSPRDVEESRMPSSA